MISNSPKFSRQSWRWVIFWATVVVLFSSLPYLIAMVLAPEGWRFAGFLINPLDGHSYLAKMAQGESGSWQFHLTYTPEAHEGSYIFVFYLLLGHLARLTGLPAILVFHGTRMVTGWLLLLVAFRFIVRITPRPVEQRLAFILLATASGLGWVGVFMNTLPIDLWVPEGFVPFSIFTNPHFPLGMALMLVIFQTVWLNDQSRLTLSTMITAAAALMLALILPFGLLTLWAVSATMLVWQMIITERRLPLAAIWLTLVAIIPAVPVIFYQYWVSTTNPVLAGWSAQNVTPAPTLLNFVLGYGLVGVLAIVGGLQIIRHRQPTTGERLLLVWAVVTVGLVYLPIFDLQRRFITGLHIPLCILAAIGILRWMNNRKLKPALRRLFVAGIVGTGLVGTLFVWAVPLVGVMQSPEESPPAARLFIRDDEQAAFDWLAVNASSDTVVLASSRVGTFIPGQTGARVFYGHPFETIEADDKEAQLEAFYRGEVSSVSPAVDLVFYGPSEGELGQPAPTDAPPVFEAGVVQIFRYIR
jgi:hypothetical protein